MARNALSRLLDAGCRRAVIFELLHGECVTVPASNKSAREEWHQQKDNLRGLIQDVRGLATKLRAKRDMLRDVEFVLSAMIDSIPENERGDVLRGICRAENLEMQLASFRDQLEVFLDSTKTLPRILKQSPIELPFLAAYVERITSDKQYPDLAILLKSAYDFAGIIEKKSSARSVRGVVDRFRMTYPKLSHKILTLTAKYFETEPSADFLDWMYKEWNASHGRNPEDSRSARGVGGKFGRSSTESGSSASTFSG